MTEEQKKRKKEQQATWYKKNRERIISANRLRQLANHEEYKKSLRDRYHANPTDYIIAARQWAINNPERVKNNMRTYHSIKRKETPWIYAWRNSLHNTLSRLNQKKNGRSKELLGYSAEDLYLHLENLFLPGMSWSNYGEWEIDHKRPVSSFPPDTPVNIVNALSNLQPLWWKDNYDKHDIWNDIENKII